MTMVELGTLNTLVLSMGNEVKAETKAPVNPANKLVAKRLTIHNRMQRQVAKGLEIAAKDISDMLKINGQLQAMGVI